MFIVSSITSSGEPDLGSQQKFFWQKAHCEQGIPAFTIDWKKSLHFIAGALLVASKLTVFIFIEKLLIFSLKMVVVLIN